MACSTRWASHASRSTSATSTCSVARASTPSRSFAKTRGATRCSSSDWLDMKTSPSDRVSVPRYRRVSTRMHNDERYRELSRPKPNGQSLWGYLLFGPRTVVIPGLLPVALETIAVDLRWPLPATRRVWEEIARHEMARADWLAPLIWLPNAPKHNPPQSPNVVRAWRRSFDDDLPPCDLKLQAEQFIQAFLK